MSDSSSSSSLSSRHQPPRFPFEVVNLIIRFSNHPSTLAAWSRVCKDLVDIAGPLLYEVVTLRKATHVAPFLRRYVLARSSSAPPPSSSVSSLLLSSYQAVRQLNILALPPIEDLPVLFENPPMITTPPTNLAIRISRHVPTSGEPERVRLWIACLPLFLPTWKFEEVRTGKHIVLSGAILDVYLRYLLHAIQQDDLDEFEWFYDHYCYVSSQQLAINEAFKQFQHTGRTVDSSEEWRSMLSKHKEHEAWFDGKDLLENRDASGELRFLGMWNLIDQQTEQLSVLGRSFNMLLEAELRSSARRVQYLEDGLRAQQPTSRTRAAIPSRSSKSKPKPQERKTTSTATTSASSHRGEGKGGNSGGGGGGGSKGGEDVKEVDARVDGMAGRTRSKVGRKVLEGINL